MAWPRPTRRGRRWVPPPPGIKPRLISGWPKRAFSEATIRSHDSASSQPPPRQKPLTMAITGLGKPLMTSKMRGERMAWRWSNGVRPANSEMSAPAMNAFSPAPVSTITPICSSFSSAARWPSRSSRT